VVLFGVELSSTEADTASARNTFMKSALRGAFFLWNADFLSDGVSPKKKTAGLEGGVSPTVCQMPAGGNGRDCVDIGMATVFFNAILFSAARLVPTAKSPPADDAATACECGTKQAQGGHDNVPQGGQTTDGREVEAVQGVEQPAVAPVGIVQAV
jgi:hypothetical protein